MEKRDSLLYRFYFLKRRHLEVYEKYNKALEQFNFSKSCKHQLTELGLELDSFVSTSINLHLNLMRVHIERMGSLFTDIGVDVGVFEKFKFSSQQFFALEKKLNGLVESFLTSERDFLSNCSDFTNFCLNALSSVEEKASK
ncbi:hypothetical protein HNY73_007277 [Argiope bruennichi]|uniref:Uncharacterized protein n=1 Tax=Argiope bruennichi TaxID=94029 RepID=A0A8T0FDZ5_ARGBR|nr:hypothetical protein HNY73_007277 [Argiope bruennichi]